MSDELFDLKKRHERLNLLFQISNVLHSTLDAQEALQLILREALRVMRASSGSVVLVNPTTGFLEIHASIGLVGNAKNVKLRIGEGITGWVARTGKPARVGNVREDARYVMLKKKVRSELAVPLEVADEVRGVLNVDSVRENAFTEEDQELLQSLAVLAAKVIHNTWLHERIRVKARLFETLVAVGQTINSTLNLDEALRVITREACHLMDAKMCSLLMVDETGEWLDLRASFGAGKDYIAKPRLLMAESLLGTVVRRKKALQIDNVQVSSRYQNVEVARREGLVSLLSVPLLFAGQAIGTVNVYKAQPHNFSNEEIRILSALAELSGPAIEKARLYEHIINMEEELRQNEKLSAIGLLAAEVAHEIRNPLTVMKMMFHSLDLNFPAKDPRARDAKIMGEKMDHLNKIVGQILNFARTTEPSFAPVDVNQLLDDLALLVRHKLRNQNVEFVRRLAPDLPPVSGDAAQLAQVFLNLTLNAAEAMPKGGRLTIVSRLNAQDAKKVLIEFKDTGEGMSRQQQERAFSSLLSTTKPQGTGLGLALVKRVIETHHGELQIKSKPGKGTTISIGFPILEES
ncbi:MAG: GAF domain-containing protein [Verrucomicrobiota bacterium]